MYSLNIDQITTKSIRTDNVGPARSMEELIGVLEIHFYLLGILLHSLYILPYTVESRFMGHHIILEYKGIFNKRIC